MIIFYYVFFIFLNDHTKYVIYFFLKVALPPMTPTDCVRVRQHQTCIILKDVLNGEKAHRKNVSLKEECFYLQFLYIFLHIQARGYRRLCEDPRPGM